MFNLKDEIKKADKIAIGGHIRPDGDCVGSTLGLYGFIKKSFPEKEVVLFLEKPAETFCYLKGYEEIDSSFERNEIFDLFITVDCSDKERLGSALQYFEAARETICIDHHISNQGFAKQEYIVPAASSSAELIYNLLEGEELDVEIAKAIYTGIIHDTGIFQYSNTSCRTMEIAGKLIEFGFDFSSIIDETFYQKTYVQNQILGRAILESILFMDGRCIVSAVDRKMMEFYNVSPGDFEGIVNQLRVTKGVDCAIFLYETDNLEYKVSMRSNNRVDVAKVSAYFGGGGHKKAAGCTMKGTFHDVINNLSLHIEEQLNNAAD